MSIGCPRSPVAGPSLGSGAPNFPCGPVPTTAWRATSEAERCPSEFQLRFLPSQTGSPLASRSVSASGGGGNVYLKVQAGSDTLGRDPPTRRARQSRRENLNSFNYEPPTLFPGALHGRPHCEAPRTIPSRAASAEKHTGAEACARCSTENRRAARTLPRPTQPEPPGRHILGPPEVVYIPVAAKHQASTPTVAVKHLGDAPLAQPDTQNARVLKPLFLSFSDARRGFPPTSALAGSCTPQSQNDCETSHMSTIWAAMMMTIHRIPLPSSLYIPSLDLLANAR